MNSFIDNLDECVKRAGFASYDPMVLFMMQSATLMNVQLGTEPDWQSITNELGIEEINSRHRAIIAESTDRMIASAEQKNYAVSSQWWLGYPFHMNQRADAVRCRTRDCWLQHFFSLTELEAWIRSLMDGPHDHESPAALRPLHDRGR